MAFISIKGNKKAQIAKKNLKRYTKYMFITEKEKEEAKKIVKSLTLHEKCCLLSGKDYWHINDLGKFHPYMISDGPSGLRQQLHEPDYFGIHESEPSICYPAPVTCASTFDRSLIYQLGESLGSDCLDQDVAMLLTPGVNHKRSPLAGRNFEYYSEDPYLSSEIASYLILGIQSKGIAPCLKHYACNNQETGRMISNSIVDERALSEIYFYPFRRIIEKTHCPAIMTAYNRLNGIYCSENKDLLELGHTFGFDGAYISDWGAVNDSLHSFQAGLNLEMPGTTGEISEMIENAIVKGQWNEEELDQRILPIVELLIQHEHILKHKPRRVAFEQRKTIARSIAESGIVLLKNEEQILPLKNNSITVIGSFAKYPRFQGTGSSKVNPIEVENLLDHLDHAYYAKGFDEQGHTNEVLLEEALRLAKKSETVLICAALPTDEESEGFDRKSLELPQGINQTIHTIAEHHKNVVVCVMCGSSITMPWINQVKGIVYTYLGGSYGQSALANVLTGQCDAQGRLAETFPKTIDQIPIFERMFDPKTSEYIESVYTGYKYYDQANIDVAYEFGYGLSYTTFSYSNFSFHDHTITCTLTNTGERKGTEIVQFYTFSSLPFSTKKLLDFKKVKLAPHKSVEIRYDIKEEDFKEYFDQWIVRQGEWMIAVGSSSRNFHHVFSFHVQGKTVEHIPLAYEGAENVPLLTREDFAQLCNVERNEKNLQRPFDQNVCLLDLMNSSWMYRMIAKQLYKLTDQIELLKTAPLRILKMNNISKQTREGMLEVFNGHYLKGFKKINQSEIKKFIQENI